MRVEFEALKRILHNISEIQQKCVKDKKGNYITVEKRKLLLNSEELNQWYRLNMRADEQVRNIISKLNNLFNI